MADELEYRILENKGDDWSEWNSHSHHTIHLFARDFYAFEVRIKPEFQPGYFRLKMHDHDPVMWYLTEPNNLDDLYERVEVRSLDTD